MSDHPSADPVSDKDTVVHIPQTLHITAIAGISLMILSSEGCAAAAITSGLLAIVITRSF